MHSWHVVCIYQRVDSRILHFKVFSSRKLDDELNFTTYGLEIFSFWVRNKFFLKLVDEREDKEYYQWWTPEFRGTQGCQYVVPREVRSSADIKVFIKTCCDPGKEVWQWMTRLCKSSLIRFKFGRRCLEDVWDPRVNRYQQCCCPWRPETENRNVLEYYLYVGLLVDVWRRNCHLWSSWTRCPEDVSGSSSDDGHEEW